MVTAKQKPTSRYIKYNEKGIKSYDYGKIINSQRKTVRKEERNMGTTKQLENINKTALRSPYFSIITLNIN